MAKEKRCKICGEIFSPFSSLQKVCSLACSLQMVQKDKAKKQKQERKELRDRVLKNDKRHQLALTQKAFNALRREQELRWFKDRGLEPTCISCGKPKGNDTWCCGHYKTVGSNSALRFDEKNTYLQHNFSCNQNLSGDIVNYKKGILARFPDGEAILEYLDNHEKVRNWSCDELIEMRKTFSRQLRELLKSSL